MEVRSADLYHQRFWNQLLAIIMERPFALNQNQLSMDAGGGNHDPGKAIPFGSDCVITKGRHPSHPTPMWMHLYGKENKW